MGFPSGWTALDENAGFEDLESKRYYALGNAVTPPVAEWLAIRIRQHLERRRRNSPQRTPG
jgi:DNA (cytosine-5)-methyltransferase 1